MARPIAIAALLAAAALLGCGDGTEDGDSGGGRSACAGEPEGETEDIVFSLHPGEERVTPATRAETIAFACRRLHAYGLAGRVEAAGPDRIKIVAERGAVGEGGTTPLVAVAIPGSLRFYDWEANLIGDPHGYDSALDAARVAAGRGPVKPCPRCASVVPLYFHFSEVDLGGEPTLTVGGTPARAMTGPDGEPIPSTGPVVEVPVGALVVVEETDRGEQRWYALRDRPAVTEDEVAGARSGKDEVTGSPALFLDLTAAGERSFRQMTKRVAARRGHFVVLLAPTQVMTRPRLSPSAAANGIDASKGIQVSGIFEQPLEAEEMVRIIDTGAAPLALEPFRGSTGE